MTNQQGAPEALRLAAEVLDWMPTSDTQRALWDRHQKALVVVKAALVEAQQPAPSAAAALPAGWVPLVITHEGQYPEEVAYGPQVLMDRLGKWLRKYFDHVVASKAQPSPTPQADSQPAPVLDSLALMKVVMQADEALAGRCTRGTTNWAAAIGKAVQDAVLAARATSDSVTAPAGGVVGYRVSDPHEPDLGHWLSEEPGAAWCVSEPLTLATPPAQAAPSVLEDAARLDFLCSTDKVRMIECEQKGLWRVYQDEAPPEAVQHHWQAIASDWHTTPRAAIDAAIAARKQGANHD